MKGYMGKVLHVNLSTGEITEEKIPDEVYENFMTGVGIGAYILYRDIPAGADPLGPDNVLGFTSGLLTGTASFMTGRWMVHAKSPLTGGIGDANAGGQFAPEIKKAGYDAIFFKGISEKPVYLHIDNKGAVLKDASHVWGMDATEAEIKLTEENTGRRKPRVALIGQSGEKQSLISGVTTDGGRIAARSGLGAVMGSKKLKALVLNGNKQVKYEDVEGMKAYSAGVAKYVKSTNLPGFVGDNVFKLAAIPLGRGRYAGPMDASRGLGMMSRYGTMGGTQLFTMAGDTPIKNWAGGADDFPRRESDKQNIKGSKLDAQEYQKYHCAQCAIGCGGMVHLKGDKQTGGNKYTHTHKPEYETQGAFGALLLNSDPDSVLYINELLNRAGMDTISAGGTVAFAIECYENGLLSKEEVGGLDLKWGNSDAIIALVEQMVERKTWLGDLLADGSKKAAERLGRGSEAYAITAGGQEPGMHDPRFDAAMAIDFSANPTPGKHTSGAGEYARSFYWEISDVAKEPKRMLKEDLTRPNEEFALETAYGTWIKMILDAIGGCTVALVGNVNNWNMYTMIEHATKWGKTPDDYMIIGKRINTLRQMFNIKHGIDPKDFFMHSRIESGRPNGPNRGRSVQTAPMVSMFWEQHGWDRNTGKPTEATMKELKIDQFLDLV